MSPSQRLNRLNNVPESKIWAEFSAELRNNLARAMGHIQKQEQSAAPQRRIILDEHAHG